MLFMVNFLSNFLNLYIAILNVFVFDSEQNTANRTFLIKVCVVLKTETGPVLFTSSEVAFIIYMILLSIWAILFS